VQQETGFGRPLFIRLLLLEMKMRQAAPYHHHHHPPHPCCPSRVLLARLSSAWFPSLLPQLNATPRSPHFFCPPLLLQVLVWVWVWVWVLVLVLVLPVFEFALALRSAALCALSTKPWSLPLFARDGHHSRRLLGNSLTSAL
jgi:hypothetical protein